MNVIKLLAPVVAAGAIFGSAAAANAVTPDHGGHGQPSNTWENQGPDGSNWLNGNGQCGHYNSGPLKGDSDGTCRDCRTEHVWKTVTVWTWRDGRWCKVTEKVCVTEQVCTDPGNWGWDGQGNQNGNNQGSNQQNGGNQNGGNDPQTCTPHVLTATAQGDELTLTPNETLNGVYEVRVGGTDYYTENYSEGTGMFSLSLTPDGNPVPFSGEITMDTVCS